MLKLLATLFAGLWPAPPTDTDATRLAAHDAAADTVAAPPGEVPTEAWMRCWWIGV